jgi:hypothetical protein
MQAEGGFAVDNNGLAGPFGGPFVGAAAGHVDTLITFSDSGS